MNARQYPYDFPVKDVSVVAIYFIIFNVCMQKNQSYDDFWVTLIVILVKT